MKTANKRYVTIKHPTRLFETIDVVPLRRLEENSSKMVGVVISPGAGISRVEFSKDDLA